MQAVLLGFELALPFLAASLIVGLVVSILQAATQIQEITLTFVPKIVVTGVVLLVAGRGCSTGSRLHDAALRPDPPARRAVTQAVALPELAAEQFVAFLLVLTRVGGLFVLAPVFSARAAAAAGEARRRDGAGPGC